MRVTQVVEADPWLARLRHPPVERFGEPIRIRLTAMTGPRRGEMCGLRWDDVDLDAGRIAIRRQRISIRRQPIDKDYPKTGRAAVQTAVHALGEFHRVEVTDFAAFTLPRDDS